MLRSSLLSLALLAACDGGSKNDPGPAPDTDAPVVDADEDGVPEGADCDDADPYTYPGAPEVPYDGADQDCDGADVTDYDGDGHDGDAVGGDDCNDANPDVHPGAEVICYDLIDEDCSAEGWSQYDCDEDGFDVTEDCADEDPSVHPGAADAWYDGADSDCDARDDYDQDEDGFRTAEVPDGSGEVGSDCDDLDAAVNPGADEVWDGDDDDCDSGTDALTDLDASTSWYGNAATGESGFAVDFAPVGDLDGDGRDDLVVGVPGAATRTGVAYLLPWGTGAELPAETARATVTGAGYLGSAVAALGGGSEAPRVAIAEIDTSSVYVFDAASLSGAVDPSTAAGVVTSSEYQLGGAMGGWTAPDGREGLLVSAYPLDGYGTFVAVIEADGLVGATDAAGALWSFSAASDIQHAAVLPDLDGDGVDEIGFATEGTFGVGRAYVVASDDIFAGGVEVGGASIGGLGAAGVQVAGAADLDGDGLGEVLLSDTAADGAAAGAGAVWVVGGPDALAGGDVAELAFASIQGVTELGGLRAGRAAADLDGDGALDVLVCAPGDGASAVRGGCAWVSGVALAAGGDHAPDAVTPTFTSAIAGDRFGTAALPWDVDHDGDADLFVSEQGEAGTLHLFERR